MKNATDQSKTTLKIKNLSANATRTAKVSNTKLESRRKINQIEISCE